MKPEQLIRANDLIAIIDSTSRGLLGLKELREEAKKRPAHKSKRPAHKSNGKCDNLYNLFIAQYRDGGSKEGLWMESPLSRYEGNDELLNVIIATLEKQLEAFKAEFDAL